jgi:hypothetical protein
MANGIAGGEGAMKRPEDVTLSREDGEALIERLGKDALTAEDRQVLGKVLTFYFCSLFTLREAQRSLKRLRALVFGEKPKKGAPPTSGGTAAGGGAGGNGARTAAAPGVPPPSAPEPLELTFFTVGCMRQFIFRER